MKAALPGQLERRLQYLSVRRPWMWVAALEYADSVAARRLVGTGTVDDIAVFDDYLRQRYDLVDTDGVATGSVSWSWNSDNSRRFVPTVRRSLAWRTAGGRRVVRGTSRQWIGALLSFRFRLPVSS